MSNLFYRKISTCSMCCVGNNHDYLHMGHPCNLPCEKNFTFVDNHGFFVLPLGCIILNLDKKPLIQFTFCTKYIEYNYFL